MDTVARPLGLHVVLLGPPGAGKGTQGARLAGKLGIPVVSTGDLLREAVAANGPLGGRVEAILSRGGLVDPATMRELVHARLARPDARRGALLDGYPRTLRQAADLDAMLAVKGRRVDAVVAIRVPEAMLVERLAARGRDDDRSEVVRERLRVYEEATAPLVAHYRRRGLLHEVRGDRPIEIVTAEILATLERAGLAARPGAEGHGRLVRSADAPAALPGHPARPPQAPTAAR